MARKGGGSGGGGSQLAQLRSRLHNEGITDRRQMKASAKKRKRGQASTEKEEQQARRDKLSRIATSAQFNPFEEKVTKPKATVLGRKVRGATGRPGAARQGGLQERTDRLLPEWLNRDKSGSFVDRRFGEADGGSMSVDDKMLERFTRERQRKANKASLFNLDDAEEEGLTHYGRSLNDLDTYDDIHLSDEETGEDRMAHFGGFGEDDKQNDDDDDDDEDRTKSKAEVMKELIAKSKAHKLQRQQIKMADDDLRQELDNDFGDLRDLLFAPGALPEPGKEEEQAKLPGTSTDVPVDAKKAKENAYDAAVREMVFERRAKPQDRLKTEEEKAQELADKLRKAEQDRLRRMRGEQINDEEENEGRKGRRSAGGGDDLDDDFELDGMTSADVYGLGQGLASQRNGAEVDDEDVEVGSDDDEEEDEEGEDEDEESDDEDDDELEEDNFSDLAETNTHETALSEKLHESLVGAKPASSKAKQTSNTTALPFTFPCPSSLDELLGILSSSKVALLDVPVVVKRIRALHHSSLAEENKDKLQALIGVLIDYVIHLAVETTPASRSDNLKVLNALVPQIFTLSKSYPVASSEHFIAKLAMMQRNLSRGLSHGALDKDAKTWPGLAECTLLKLTGTVWPTSDQKHAVTTPLALLVCNYLANCRVRNLDDAVKAIFLASLVLKHEQESKRLVPEALNMLHNAISLLAPLQSTKELGRINRQFGIPWPDVAQARANGIRMGGKDGEVLPEPSRALDLVELSSEGVRESDSTTTKGQLLLASFTLVDEFVRLYAGSSAFVELFQPFEMLLVDVIKPFTSVWLEEARRKTQEHITRTVINAQRQRRALRLQAHRAIPLASHVPKFDQGFNPERKGGRTFDPDSERAEVAKLRALAKKERKGAMRELRRDNEFLAEARRQARQEEDQRYAKSIDKIMGSLSAERGEEKSYLREKQRIKRRSGKK